MGLFKGFVMSLGMFSIIPVPKNSWDDKRMPMVLPCLPLVGALLGIIWYGLAYALALSPVPLMLQGAAVLFTPFVLSGFIHADGYMDAADAVFSRRGLDEKKRILKDPHLGAFAVIAFVGLLIFQFSAAHALMGGQKQLAALIFIPIISRSVASAALLNIKPVFETGFNASFRTGTKPRHTVFVCAVALACLAAAWLMLGIAALPVAVGALAGIVAVVYLRGQFKGMSGDLGGCAITVSEFAALLCLALI